MRYLRCLALIGLLGMPLAGLAEDAPEAVPKSGSTETGPEPFGSATPLEYADVAGRWVGEVREDGVAGTYRIQLDFRASGAGEVHYQGAGYDCRGVLAPRSKGRVLVFIEAITLRRDQCSDGEVYITVENGRMDWRWGFSPDEIYATAVLVREK